MNTDLIPVLSLENNNEVIDLNRVKLMSSRFKELYGSTPQFFARAPGRVNLIGEHVDYSGYPVLPMAIENDTLIAVRVKDDKNDSDCCFANMDELWPSLSFNKIDTDPFVHSWGQYVKVGYKGILESSYMKNREPIAFNALVHGTVPLGSGLSSSAALVCSSALATMQANRLQIPKNMMAEICQHCENFIGLMNGGLYFVSLSSAFLFLLYL